MMSDTTQTAGTTAPATGDATAGAAVPNTTTPAAPAATTNSGVTAAQTGDTGTSPVAAEGGDANVGDKGAQAPETYTFTVPEGVQLDVDATSEFTAIAKELKLSTADAQRVADVAVKMQQKAAESAAATVKGWLEQCNTDKEFGGDKLTENTAVARKAIDTFGSEELKTLLNSTGLGNHPEIIRFAFRAGKAIASDGFVRGSGTQASASQSHADTLYGKT